MKENSPVHQLGNFVDRPWGDSEIGGTGSDAIDDRRRRYQPSALGCCFGANAAWLALNVMTNNLAVGAPDSVWARGSSPPRHCARRKLQRAGSITRRARRFTVHMPVRWPWADRFVAALGRYRDIVLEPSARR